MDCAFAARYGELREALDVSAHRNRRPRDWQAQGIPLLWWRAVLVSLLMKPKREVIDGAVALAVRKQMAPIKLPAGCPPADTTIHSHS